MTEDEVRVAGVCFYRVVHKAGIRIRKHPAEAPGSTAKVLPHGTVIRGRRIGDFVQLCNAKDAKTGDGDGASSSSSIHPPPSSPSTDTTSSSPTPNNSNNSNSSSTNSDSSSSSRSSSSSDVDQDGVVCGPQGFWVPFTAKGLAGLERVGGSLDAVGKFWYRVVSPKGMQFLAEPRLDAPRLEATHLTGAVVKASRKRSSPGSPFLFAELDGGLGFVIEARPSAAAISVAAAGAARAGAASSSSAATTATVGGEKGDARRRNSRRRGEAAAAAAAVAAGRRPVDTRDVRGRELAPRSSGSEIGGGGIASTSDGSGGGGDDGTSPETREDDPTNDDAHHHHQWAIALHERSELLERFDGKAVLEAVSPEERDLGKVYLRVCHPGGLRVREGPDLKAKGTGRVLAFHSVFVGVEVLKPAGVSDVTFVRIKEEGSSGCGGVDGGDDDDDDDDFLGREHGEPSGGSGSRGSGSSSSSGGGGGGGWVCAVRGKLLAAEVLSPPKLEAGGEVVFYQVVSRSPVPVLTEPSPHATLTGKQMGLGMVFGSSRRYTPMGCADRFVELNTQEVSGWVAEASLHPPSEEELEELRAEAEDEAAAAAAASTENNLTGSGGGGGSGGNGGLIQDRHLDFLLSGGGLVLKEVLEPKWDEGPWLCQVLYPGGMRVRLNPHEKSHPVPGAFSVIPAYAVVKVDGSLTITDKHASKAFVGPAAAAAGTTAGTAARAATAAVADGLVDSSDTADSTHTSPNTAAAMTSPHNPPSHTTATATAAAAATSSDHLLPATRHQPVRLLSAEFGLGRSSSSEYDGDSDYYDYGSRSPQSVEEGFEDNYDDEDDGLPLPLSLEPEETTSDAAGPDAPPETALCAPPPGVAAAAAAAALPCITRVFLKLSGRPGWLVQEHGGRPVTQLVPGTPSEDRGRFVYRVASSAGACEGGGVRVRHGPTHGAPPLDCVLFPGTLVAGRVRLRAHPLINADGDGGETGDIDANRSGSHGGRGDGDDGGGLVFLGGDFAEEEKEEMSNGEGASSLSLAAPKTATGWLPTSDLDGTCLLEFVSEKIESSTAGKPLSDFDPKQQHLKKKKQLQPASSTAAARGSGIDRTPDTGSGNKLSGQIKQGHEEAGENNHGDGGDEKGSARRDPGGSPPMVEEHCKAPLPPENISASHHGSGAGEESARSSGPASLSTSEKAAGGDRQACCEESSPHKAVADAESGAPNEEDGGCVLS